MTASSSVPRDPVSAIRDEIVRAGDPWHGTLRRGQTLRIVDLEGTQAVDTLFYRLDDPAERYSASETIRNQGSIYLTTGTALRSNRGRTMLTITADTCGRHDTLGGACAAESNQVRYALDKRWMHSCRDNFLTAIAQLADQAERADGHGCVLTARDLTANINFFMNVPVTPAGGLTFADGISAPGSHVDLRAEMDVLVLISNCPQLNNPCNGWNPTPIRLLIWDP